MRCARSRSRWSGRSSASVSRDRYSANACNAFVTIAGKELRLHQRERGVGREPVDRHPSLGGAHRIARAVARNRLSNGRGEHAGVASEQRVPLLIGPIVEAGRMSELKSAQKVRDVHVGRLARRGVGGGKEVANVALRRRDQANRGSVDVKRVTDRVSQMRQRLTKRDAGLFLRVLAPQQRGDFVPAVRARLEREKSQQRQALVAEDGCRYRGAVDRRSDAAAQGE